MHGAPSMARDGDPAPKARRCWTNGTTDNPVASASQRRAHLHGRRALSRP